MIGANAFEGYTSLASINIPDSVVTVEEGAFDMVIYDPASENVLDQTVENLADSTFGKVDGKYVVQKESVNCAESVTYELNLLTGTLTISGSGKMNSYSVGEAPWFCYGKSIRSVEIGDSVTSIGDHAFEGFTSIESIFIPDSVETIGISAFEGCSNLASVKLGKSVDSIGESAFGGCTSLVSFVVSEDNGTYLSIDGVLFSKDKAVLIQYPAAKADASYELPATVWTIAASAFGGCTSLASITIPDSVTSIGDFAFSGCPSLASVSIPYSVSSIGAGAFDGKFFENKTELKQTVANLAGFTFLHHGGKWIKQNEVGMCGEGVTYEFDFSTGTLIIGGSGKMNSYSDGKAPWSFHRDYVRSIVIADSVTSICDSAFKDCTALKELTVPATLDSVGSNENPIFEGCTHIEKVTFTGSGNWYVYGPDENPPSYYGYAPWQLSNSTLTTVLISDGVTSVGDNAFRDCIRLDSVTISDSVTSIGNGAFAQCSSIDSLVIPESVSFIGSHAFSGCSSLTSIDIPDAVASVGSNVFDGCLALGSINVGENNKNYISSDGVLLNKDRTVLIRYPAVKTDSAYEVPNTVASLVTGAFSDCRFLQSVTIPDSVTYIGNSAFSGCTSLKSLVIPDSVTDIGSSAFQQCTSLTSITLGCHIESIGDHAFDGKFYDKSCEKELEPTVLNLFRSEFKNIGGKWIKQASSPSIKDPFKTEINYEFDADTGTLVIHGFGSMEDYSEDSAPWNIDRDSIRSVLILGAVTSVGNFAFYRCASLAAVSLPDSIASIGDYAFEGCTSLSSVSFPDSVRTIGDYAFEGCTSLSSVSFPDSVRTIGDYAFEGCTSFTSALIPDSVTSVGDYVFEGCTALTSISISARIASFGSTVFDGKFYDIDGETELQQTVVNLAGFSFKNIEGKWVLQISGVGICGYTFHWEDDFQWTNIHHKTKVYDPTVYYRYDEVTGTLKILGYGAISDFDEQTAPWDSYKDSIKHVIIGDSITAIGKYAFEGCTSLVSVSIPDSVTYIGIRAFQNCTSLKSITLPPSLPNLEYGLFRGCTSLKSVIIPDSVTYIGWEAFENCASLTSLAIPDSVTQMGEWVFYGCSSLKSISLPDSVTNIGQAMFYGCSSLESFVISDSVGYIGWYAFQNCTSLKSITIPDSVTSIGSHAFYYCTSLKSVKISNSITSIPACMFCGCSGLAAVTIPDSVTSIGSNAFYGCSSLASLTIPDTVTSLGESAFYGCIGLSELIVPVHLNCVGTVKNPIFEKCKNIEKITITGSGNWFEYNTTDSEYTPWQISKRALIDVDIGDGVTSIGNSAFSGCARLKFLFIPDSVKSLGISAFKDCNSLKELTIPADIDCVVTNKNPVFEGCTNIEKITFTGSGDWFGYDVADSVNTPWQFSGHTLTNVIISEGITSIGDYAFEGCTSLASLTISDSVIYLGDSAFYDCTGLTELTVPAGLNCVGSAENSIFEGCMNIEKITFIGTGDWFGYDAADSANTPWQISKHALADITISEGVASVGDYAFTDSTSLTSLTIPDSVKSIGTCAFKNCTSLTSIYISNSVTSIRNGTFENCSRLVSVNIPDSVISIGDYAFSGCTSLASVSLPDSLTSIGSSAFRGCTSFTSIVIPDSVISLGDSAFCGCTGLSGLTVPAKLNSAGTIENPVFEGCTNIEKITFTGSGDWFAYDATDSANTPWQISKNVLTRVIISDNITSIGAYAFRDCTSLTSITIPDSVISLGDSAFYDCTGLTELAVPAGLDCVGTNEKPVFEGCTNFKKITFTGSGDWFGYDAADSVNTPWQISKRALTRVVISDNVTSIGSYAFRDCTSLTSVYLSDALTSIEAGTFYNCSRLASVIIPGSVTSVKNYAFYGCTSLAAVSLPESLVSIGSSAFSGCSSIASVSLPDSVTSIGFYAFHGCTSLSSLGLGKSITHIGGYAFDSSAGLTTLAVPDSVTSIGTRAFCGEFYGVDGKAQIEPTVTNLAGSKFCNVDGKWIKLGIGICGEDVTYEFNAVTGLLTVNGTGSMYDYADGAMPWYSYKENIKSIVLGDSVTSVGGYAFSDCLNLRELTVPISLNCVGSEDHPAFADCINLGKITFTAGLGYWYDHGALTPKTPWYAASTALTVVFSDSITFVGSSAFKDCIPLTSVYFDASVVSIGESAFSGCTNIVSLTIPDTVRSVRGSAFADCTGLKDLTIPISLDWVGSDNGPVFSGCVNIEKITFTAGSGKWCPQSLSGNRGSGSNLPWNVTHAGLTVYISDGITYVGSAAFKSCTSVTSVFLGDSVKSIESHAFYECKSLTSVSLGSVETIGYCAFMGCDSLASALIPDSVETIGVFAFAYCPSITSLVLGRSVATIGDSAFSDCTALRSVVIKSHISAFGNGAFAFCRSLEYIDLGDSLKSIGIDTFWYCTSLTSVVIPGTVTSIDISAFGYCTSLESVTIPDSVGYIGENAFDVTFYDTDGETKLEPTAANLAGYTFKKVEDKFIKQKSTPSEDPNVISGKCGEEVAYELNLSTGILTINGYGLMESYCSGKSPWFLYKDSITSIVISGNVTSIGDFAFEGITSIGSVTIPDSVASVGASAFEGCFNLATVKLGMSVDSLDRSAFEGCTSLASYVVSDDNGTYSSIDGVLFSKDKTALIQYPVANEGTAYEIPGTVKIIKSSAFKGCTSLSSITIPDSVETVEEGAFDIGFYDPAGENALDQTVEKLAGSTFGKVNGKFVKQKESGKCGENVAYVLDFSTGALTIGGSGEMNSYFSGKAPWFSHRVSIKSIEIADTVASIGDFAFEGITAIDTVAISDSVETIGASAFEGCTSIASFAVSEKNESYSSIEGVLFSHDKTRLIKYPVAKAGTSYEIPDTVEAITSFAFKGCASLISITIPKSVTSVEKGAFDREFYDSDGKIELEPTAEILAGSAFNNVGGKWIKVKPIPSEDPNKISGECGENVTYEFDTSAGILTIGGSGEMNSYSDGEAPWFSHKDTIISVHITGSVTSIGDFAFYGCTSLASVTIPDSVETVGVSAFEGCTKLATVNFGKSVRSVDETAFKGCISLASYAVSDENRIFASIDGVLFSKDGAALLQYPVAKEGTSYEIPGIVKIIKSSAFKSCASLSSITIPDSVTSVEAGAFDMIFYDSAGENVLDQTVENLAGSAFDNKDGKWIKQVSVPPVDPDRVSGECGENVTYVLNLSTGALTLSGSGRMGSYSKGDAPWYSNRDTITSIVIGDNITSIGDFAFEGITYIESILIPDTVETIGASSFEGCSDLATVKLGKSVDSIDMSAFEGCSSLASYIISEDNGTYTSVDGVLFSKDKAVLIQYPTAKTDASYEIPAAVKIIKSSAFKCCASLASIAIPNSVTSIEEGAFDMDFYGPAGEIVLEPTVEKLAGSTFDNKGGKWIKQTSVSPVDPDRVSGECGEGVIYELDISAGTLTIGGSGQMKSYSRGNAPWDSSKGTITSIVIGDKVTSVGDHAFEGFTAIGFVTIPDSVTSLGTSSFADCTGLKELTVPASLDCVGSNDGPAFSGCVNIEKITFVAGSGTWYGYNTGGTQSVSVSNAAKFLNDTVFGTTSELSNYVFAPWQLSRSTLTTVTICDGVTSIGDSAFKDCTSLTSVTLPDSVRSFGNSVFDGCISLTTIHVSEESSKYRFVDGVLYDKYMTELILYPAGNVNTSFEIPASVTSIGAFAFQGNTYLTAITIPDTVNFIAYSAFSYRFYDTDGGSEISQTVAGLAGSTFEKIDGKWIRYSSATLPAPPPSLSDTGSGNGSTIIYLFVALVVAIASVGAFAVVKKRRS